MVTVSIAPVVTRQQQEQFYSLPWELYRDDPHWVPPIRSVQRKLVGFAQNPFYRNAQTQAFLATRGSRVCGRIVAVLNRSYNQYYEKPLGFFGFFESIDDEAVAGALFDAVRDWFSAQGIHSLCGPVNPDFEYTVGLLVEGFDSSPMFLTTYNPPYYARLMEACGLDKSQDLLAYGGNTGMLPEFNSRLGPIAQQIAERFGIRVRQLSWRQMLDEVDGLVDIYNRSMGKHWGFVPLSQREARHLIQQVRHLLLPEFSLAAEIDGRIVAFALGLPDYNPYIKRIGGRLFPLGFLHLLLGKRRFKSLRILSANVAPEYQRMGIPLVLLWSMAPATLRLGIEKIEFSWILESNRLSCGSLEKGGASIVKRYRVYGWQTEGVPTAAANFVRAPAMVTRQAVGQPAAL